MNKTFIWMHSLWMKHFSVPVRESCSWYMNKMLERIFLNLLYYSQGHFSPSLIHFGSTRLLSIHYQALKSIGKVPFRLQWCLVSTTDPVLGVKAVSSTHMSTRRHSVVMYAAWWVICWEYVGEKTSASVICSYLTSKTIKWMHIVPVT